MPSPPTPLVPVLCAERGSGWRPTEDRIFTSDRVVAVLDGASQPEATERDGGWLADQLGGELMRQLRLDPRAELTQVLEDSIREVAKSHDLEPGESPATTVALVRWDVDVLDVLVLCDSAVVALDRHGDVREVRDDRLAVATAALRRPAGPFTDDIDGWRGFAAEQHRVCNRPGGYWVAEADPEAARHAVTERWPVAEMSIVLAMTDGVSIGVDQYGVPHGWPEAIALAADNPRRLVDSTHHAESGDLSCQRWPRSKRHDDKALAVLRFDRIDGDH